MCTPVSENVDNVQQSCDFCVEKQMFCAVSVDVPLPTALSNKLYSFARSYLSLNICYCSLLRDQILLYFVFNKVIQMGPKCLRDRKLPSSLMPLFQNESSCIPFHIEIE